MINNKGQSLLEVIVALAIFALISATMVSLSTGGFVSMNVGGEQTEAQALAGEGVEAVRAIRDRAWNELTFTTSSVATSTGQWIFSGENTTAQLDNYFRTISFDSVCRDVSNNIVACPGLYTDAQTKKVTSQIDWPVMNTTNTVKQVTYLTNWDALNWVQTNWLGGSGQSVWSDITKYFSDDGNVNASTTGNLQLKYTPSSGCGPMIWDFSNQYSYSYDNSKIEVVGGFGQLKDIGSCSGTTSTCATLTSQSSCQALAGCSWTPSYASTNPTINNFFSYTPSQISYWSGFSETAVPNGGVIYYQLSNDDGVSWKYWNGSAWVTSTLATNYNTSSTINTNIITFPTSTKKMMFKVFLVSDGNNLVKLDQVQIDCSQIYDWDFETPASYNYPTTTIIVSSSMAQLNNLGSTSVCSGTTTVCSTIVSSTNCTTAGCSWSAGGDTTYATTSPSISSVISLSLPTTTFYKWTRFIETATTNGGSISYQLSNNDGTTWQFWNGSAWATAGAENYNSASVVNTNINTFATSTGKLMYKAFLTSNGTQLVQLDNIQVWWQETTGVSSYATLGSVISSAYNLSDISPVSVISWTPDLSACSNCSIKFQIRTASNNGGVPGTWSPWYGVNGADDYFIDYRGSIIPKVLNWNQWVQYQAWLLGDGNSTPILNDVTVYYK